MKKTLINLLVIAFTCFLLIASYGAIRLSDFSPVQYNFGSILFYNEAILRDTLQNATINAFIICGILSCLLIVVHVIDIIIKKTKS